MKSITLKLGLLATSALAALMLAGCGDDGSSGGNGPSGEAVVANKTITGVSQKGPFVNGSSITVQELDKTLAQTGKSFKGKISNDKGEFSVPNVTLSSKYALLEANGYYWNENTGRQSAGPITLNALADLSKRDNVNINLLTHLEYERALYLISTSKGVADAKKQAEGEIFKAFGVTGDFANSEELDILAKGEGDAALLAISVLMQGNLTEAQLSGRLADFASDIAQDGTWDDEAMKTTIADWASSADLNAIRANVELLEPGSKAPVFEQVVKAFWWNNYGLGECSSKNQSEVRKNGNEQSLWCDNRYVCDNGDWRRATVLEYDLYGWNPGADGEIKKGNVSDASYKYDSLQGQWSAANDRDVSLGLNGCTQNREGEVVNTYICREGQWQNATSLEYDTYKKTCSRNSELVAGAVVGTNQYVCDADKFRTATTSEKIVGRGCTSYNLGEEKLVAGYVTCSASGSWTVSTRTVAGTMTDERDGKSYQTIGIGIQTWMTEDLDYEYKISGATYGNWCGSGPSSPDSCDKYGRSYTWAAAMDTAATGCGGYSISCSSSHGVCPLGWHIPSVEEWGMLFDAVSCHKVHGSEFNDWDDFCWDDDGGTVHDGTNLDGYGFPRPTRNIWNSSRGYVWVTPQHIWCDAWEDTDPRTGLAVRCVRD